MIGGILSKTRRRIQPKQEQDYQLTFVLWTISVIAVLLLVVQYMIYDRDDALLRLLLVISAIGVPTIFLFMQNKWDRQDVINFEIDPALIVLSGALGLVVWTMAWWGMSVIQEDILFDVLGSFRPPSVYLPANLEDGWLWLVLGDVVFIPLALMILLWGGLRRQIQNAPVWQSILLFGFYLGLLGALLFGQGIAGMFGYGLCGITAGFVSIYGRSAWAGLATHATFMYANRAFLDDLLWEMTYENESGLRVSEPHFGTQWLSLVLVAGLMSIALMQVIRFRSDFQNQAKSSTLSPNKLQWGAIGLAIIVFVLLIVNEAQRST